MNVAMVVNCLRAISLLTGTPLLRALETAMAVRELLWQETQPDFRRKVTSVFCRSGRLRATAARGLVAGGGLEIGPGGSVISFAPALISRSTTGVLPRWLAKSRAVSPCVVLAWTSAPRSISART